MLHMIGQIRTSRSSRLGDIKQLQRPSINSNNASSHPSCFHRVKINPSKKLISFSSPWPKRVSCNVSLNHSKKPWNQRSIFQSWQTATSPSIHILWNNRIAFEISQRSLWNDVLALVFELGLASVHHDTVLCLGQVGISAPPLGSWDLDSILEDLIHGEEETKQPLWCPYGRCLFGQCWEDGISAKLL